MKPRFRGTFKGGTASEVIDRPFGQSASQQLAEKTTPKEKEPDIAIIGVGKDASGKTVTDNLGKGMSSAQKKEISELTKKEGRLRAARIQRERTQADVALTVRKGQTGHAEGKTQQSFYEKKEEEARKNPVKAVRFSSQKKEVAQVKNEAPQQNSLPFQEDTQQKRTLTPAKRPNLFTDPESFFKDLSARQQQRSDDEKGSIKGQVAGWTTIPLGWLIGASGVVQHPKRTIKETVMFPVDVAKETFKPEGRFASVGEELKSNPGEFAGKTAGSGFMLGKFFGLGKRFKKSSVNFGELAKEPASIPEVKSVSGEPRGMVSTDFVVKDASRPGKVSTISFEAGSRSLPLFSKTEGEGVKVGGPRVKNKLAKGSLADSVDMPATPTKGKILIEGLDLSPQEKTRVRSALDVTRAGRSEKGLPVKDVLFKIEDLKNPKKATKTIEGFISEEKGVVFGSATTQQLPKKHQNKIIGDVDIFLPEGGSESINPKLEILAKKLRKGGERVRISPSNPHVLEFTKSRKKLLEVKLGTEPGADGSPIAQTGFLGIEFANLKGGEKPKGTVPFGKARAIKAGEQLSRKAAGATIVSPGDLKAETPSFEGPGMLGRQGGSQPRGLKDTAGFIQEGEGIIDIKQSKWNPVEKWRASRMNIGLQKFFGTYTAEQQADIRAKIDDTTGKKTFKLSIGGGKKKEIIPDLVIGEKSFSPSPAVRGKDVSPSRFSISESPGSAKKSESLYDISSPGKKSQSPFGKSPSKSISPSGSASGSPSLSPSSPSPSKQSSPSPKIPSPSSPSPGLSKSPGSSPSPMMSPSPSSPSPGRSKSPSIPSFSLSQNKSQSKGSNVFSSFSRGFDVFVRRGGKFFKVSRDSLPKEDAFNLGAFTVGNTAAATFELRESNRPAKGKFHKRIFVSDFENKSKSDRFLRFVEKPGRRIKSAGELFQITYKGINARRRGRGWF